ncbi:MAG TPA: site-specific integrase [Egibacteraceae bacterium]|nr:site-specific integrase [Egibacteraceae bacterium]
MAKKRARRHHGGSIRELKSGRWQVRVHDRATGRHVPLGTFPTKEDANAALAASVADQNRGKWVTPQRGQVPVGDYCQRWIDEHTGLGPRTRDTYQSLLSRHIAPHLGESNLGHLTTATVRRWHTKLHREASPSTAAKAYRLLRAVCNTAVEDGVLAVNPCQVKGAGVERPDERPIATVAEVEALVDAVPPRYRALVLLAAWCSLRLGELAALTRADLDLLHGKVKVTKNLQRLDDGTLVVLKPKSEAGRRTVTIPPPLLPDIEAHLKAYAGAAPDALVFTNEQGRPIHRHRWFAIWRRARLAVGRPDLRFHDLRHTGNTLAAATGASTAELMARMGHNSPRAALIYQHATQDRDEAIARALGELIRPAPVADLDDHRETR